MLNGPGNSLHSWRLAEVLIWTSGISDGVIQENPHEKAQLLVGPASPAPPLWPCHQLPARLVPLLLMWVSRPGAAGLGVHTISGRTPCTVAQDGTAAQLVRSRALLALDKPERQQETAQGRRWLWLFHFRRACFWDGTLGGKTGSVAILGLQVKPTAQDTPGSGLHLDPWGCTLLLVGSPPLLLLVPCSRLCISDPEGEAEGAPKCVALLKAGRALRSPWGDPAFLQLYPGPFLTHK